MYKSIRLELTERFGRLTAYSRSPATGLWKDDDEELTVDKLIVYEVIANDFEKKFWKSFKEILKAQLKQEDKIIRCTGIDVVRPKSEVCVPILILDLNDRSSSYLRLQTSNSASAFETKFFCIFSKSFSSENGLTI